MPNERFMVERQHPTVVTVRLNAPNVEWEQWFLLRSDAHHDNTRCNWDLERRHLEEAKERDAGIIDFGDLYCAMQGKWDKRADLSQLRPELQSPKYLDRLVEEAYEFYRPYASNWTFMSSGNHETSILGRHQTNLTERLAQCLKMSGSKVEVGTYQGWIRFGWTRINTQGSYRLRYTHGYGGGGPVTKDLIQVNRQLANTENVDILVSGHTHDQFYVPVAREYIDHHGAPQIRTCHCIKCGGYKDDYSSGGGWTAEKGHPPRPLGAFWIRFYVRNGIVHVEVRRAD